VALLTVRTHCSFVNVGVAIGASGSYVGKDRLGVTLGASHIVVHPAQRIFGLVVVKFRDRADGLPSDRGVAVLAGNVQISVRAPSLSIFRGLPVGRTTHP
jgi:hypothetical protein